MDLIFFLSVFYGFPLFYYEIEVSSFAVTP